MITYTQAAKQIRALGFTVKRDDFGDIRVGWPRNESAAYYASDAADALQTALRMSREVPPADTRPAMIRAARLHALDTFRGRS